MNLKGIMQTLGAKPGQVVSNPYARAFAPQPTITEAEGEDHEVSMAQNSLDTIIKMATELKAKMGENEKDIPAWIQDHITNSENFISQASSNYHEYSTNEAGINGAPRFPSLDGVANEAVELPTTALPSTVKSKLTIAIDTIKDAELTYNQKVQVVKQVTDSLGIDKTEFNKIASRLKGTMESVNESAEILKPGTKVKLRGGKTGKVVRYDGKTPGSPFYIVDIGQYYSIEVPADEIKTESVNEGKTYSNKFAAWFTGTVLNTVKHPTYGTHQLTADQIQKASGDYKTKLFKAIEVAVKNGDITPDVIRKNESLRLTKLK